MVLLRLIGEVRQWTFQELARDLCMSVSEVHQALKRSEEAGLYDGIRRKVKAQALLELLVHGLRYVFPAKRLPRGYGIPTAHSMEPLASRLVLDSDDRLVWPHPGGLDFGDAIEPLYKSAPAAALREPKLHRRLALVDALRVGRTRERSLHHTDMVFTGGLVLPLYLDS